MTEIEQLRERVLVLEKQVGELRAATANASEPLWKRNLGLFAGDPTFDEINKLGARIRRSGRPTKSKRVRSSKSRKTARAKVVSSAKRTA